MGSPKTVTPQPPQLQNQQSSDKQQTARNTGSQEYEKQIAILKQEVQQLSQNLNEAKQREQQQKQVYDNIISVLQDDLQKKNQQSEVSYQCKSIDIPVIAAGSFTSEEVNLLQDKIKSLTLVYEEIQKKLHDSESNIKLLQKDYDFTQRSHQTTINHLKLENQRLKEELNSEKQRFQNELQLQTEERLEKEQQTLKEIQDRFEGQIEDLKHLHWQDKAKLKEEADRVKNELRILRLEHSELISNTNIGDHLERLHDQYFNEIQLLNSQLSAKSTETNGLIQSIERDKSSLLRKITELEDEVQTLKATKDKLKKDSSLKNLELKEKLQKAFQQLTANDEAASELQSLRQQIKDLQERIGEKRVNNQSIFNSSQDETQENNSEIKKMDDIAKNLSNQINVLKQENEKLNFELKSQLKTARSVSPPSKIRKVDSSKYEESKEAQNKSTINPNVKVRGNKYGSPQNLPAKHQKLDSQDYYYVKSDAKKNNCQQNTKKRGFLNQSKAKQNMQLNSDSDQINNYLETGDSLSSSPKHINVPNQGAASERVYYKVHQNGRDKIFGKHQNSNNDMSGITLNTTAISQNDYLNSMIMHNKKNMGASLSSNQLLGSSTSIFGSTMTLQKLQSQIESVKCSCCQQTYTIEEFIQHTRVCSQNEQETTLSPIKSRNNKLQRVNSHDSSGRRKKQPFEKIQKPREEDSYCDDFQDYSTDLGGLKSQYGGNNGGVAQRPSFLSSVDYNSFMDNNKIQATAQTQFSPETLERANSNVFNAIRSSKLSSKQLEDKIKFFESMFRQAQENVHNLNQDLRKKEVENERLIQDLKGTKIQIALLEESTAQREFMMKSQIDVMRKQQQESLEKAYSSPEVTLNLHTTNVSCFNIGRTQVTNAHEIKIDPTKFLQKATVDLIKNNPQNLRTPPQYPKKGQDLMTPNEPVYQETVPSTGYRLHSSKQNDLDTVYDSCKLQKCEPKRLRSQDNYQKYTVYSDEQNFQQNQLQSQSLSFCHTNNFESCNISQDVQPESKPTLSGGVQGKMLRMMNKPQRGIQQSPKKPLTSRCSPKPTMKRQ